MARTVKKAHQHKWLVVAYNRDLKRPRLSLRCSTKGCGEERWAVCPLCEEDGNRRRHKRHHDPVTDRTLFNRVVLIMTNAAAAFEKAWGKPVWTLKDGRCGLHGRAHWTSREDKATGHYACEVCHPSGLNGHDHTRCPGDDDGASARPMGRAEVRPVDDRLPQASAHRAPRNPRKAREPRRVGHRQLNPQG